MELLNEDRALVEEVRSVARTTICPLAAKCPPGRLNRELVQALGTEDLLARVFPSGGVGGAGARSASAVDLCALREGLAFESAEADAALALQGLGGYPIMHGGRPEAVKHWLPGISTGKIVAAFALTEPDAGSDAGALELRADDKHGGYVLSGEKIYISNAPEADVYTVFARTTKGAGARGVTAFLVPGDTQGLTGAHVEMLPASHAIGALHFEDVFVSADNVLGELDGGFQLAMRTLGLFRPSVGAAAVGMAQAALAIAVQHAATRRAFGRQLSEFQAVSHPLAEMATRLEAARLLVYAAADAYDRAGTADPRLSPMAKLFATETAQNVVDVSIQIHGAAALRVGHRLEALYREVRGLRIYEGTSEIQREIIAKELLREAAQ